MKTLITSASLDCLEVHSFCDRHGNQHITGFSWQGILAVPTTSFWRALADIADAAEPRLGDEYLFLESCRVVFGNVSLYLSVHVDDDGNALVTDVDRMDAEMPGLRTTGEWTEDPASTDAPIEDVSEFPLFAAAATTPQRLWGWQDFLALPADTICEGDVGHARFSMN